VIGEKARQLSTGPSVVGSRHEEDDADLVRRCLAGDSDCFSLLVERYERVLYNLALRMVGNEEDAKDVVQSGFVKAYQKLSTFDPRFKFFSWVYKITLNDSLNLLQRRKPTEAIPDQLPAETSMPGDALDRERLGQRIEQALQQLTPDYRQVIVLRHFLELSYREMAEVIGIPEKTIKSRLFSARRSLCEILSPEGGLR
jgi:RNA polymerase sigma-70 factor (ECF subfamily)